MKNLNRVNLLWLLFLPYICKTVLIIFFEIFIKLDIKNLLILIITNVVIIYLGTKMRNINYKLKIIIYAITIVSLYYKLIIQEYFIIFNSITTTVIILIVVTSLVLKIFWERLKKWKIFFSVFLVLFSIINLNKEYANLILPKNENLKINKKYDKIFFIVLDEYSSPLELYKKYSDTNIHNFSNYLKKLNWVVYENVNSENTQTIKSLGSIFNFGLTTSDNDNNIYSINLLNKSQLINNLEKENYYILNQSFLQIGRYKETHEIFFKYPRNIFEILIYNTFIFEYIRKYKITTPEYYNIETIEKMNKMKIKNNKFFVYIHLLMPHPPFFFKEEINVIKQNDYLKYWKFTNQKMMYTLIKLQENNPNAKIIIMGDHGFRGDNKINAKKTFIATYGFEKIFKENKSQEIFKIIL
jgi:hypothetical protein